MVRTHPRSFRRKHLLLSPVKPNPGSAPGVLRADPSSHPTSLKVIGYGADEYAENRCGGIADIEQHLGKWPVTWVHVSGLGDIELIEQLGTLFGLDRLSLEDVLDTSHRPKVEYYENYVFTIVKSGMLGEEFESEQISLFLKKNVVIAFQERPNQGFEQVRERIRRGTGKIRHAGADYLYYAMLDEVIDNYFPILDTLNHQLAQMEEAIVTAGRDPDIIQRIHHSKTDLLLLHRTIWPITDIVSMLMREDSPLITKNTRSFLRDCYDHSIQANELAQFYRETAAGLLNTFLAYEGHKTNEIVKVLTMVSAVFIPLNFIAGIYGMNFKVEDSPFNMPELEWYYGYPFALGMMLLVALFMLIYFKRRGWIWEAGTPMPPRAIVAPSERATPLADVKPATALVER